MKRFNPRRRSHSSPAVFEGLEQLEGRQLLATVHWTGAGDGVTLMSKFNWAQNNLPGPGDTAIIDVAGDPALEHAAGVFKVKNLILGEKLSMTGGELRASESVVVNGTLNIGGGLVDDVVVKGHARVDVFGKLRWTGGKLWGNGKINVKQGGTFVIDGTGRMDLRRDVFNAGTTVWKAGDIDGVPGPGTTWTNESGGLFKAMADARFRDFGSPDKFINHGTFVRDGAGATRFLVEFNNTGTVNVAAGTLEIFDGGTNTGARNVAAGATLHYFRDYAHGAGSTLSGGGRTIWQGGVHTLTAAQSMASYLIISNATVTGPGHWTIDGVLSWSHGRIEGAGATTIGPAGKIEIMTLGQHDLARDIDNDGTLIWNRGELRFDGATVTNNAGKAFYLAANATAENASGDSRIVNHGEMRKMLPTAMGLGAVTLDNQGLVNIRNGSLLLDPLAVEQVSGTTLTGGAWSVYGLATLSFAGTSFETIGEDAFVERIGRFAGFDAINTVTVNEGTMQVSGGGALSLGGPTFINVGTLVLRKGTTLEVQGNFVQTETGVLDVGIASLHRLGTGRVISAMSASLAGTLAVTLQGGFEPQAGHEFLVLEAGLVQGTFATLDFGPVGQLVYLTDGVLLVYS